MTLNGNNNDNKSKWEFYNQEPIKENNIGVLDSLNDLFKYEVHKVEKISSYICKLINNGPVDWGKG
jgi:hypothetical protein